LKRRGADHKSLFYQLASSLGTVTYNLNEKPDANGNPIGLSLLWLQNFRFNRIYNHGLRHQPNKTAVM
jgi:hypothetical protein